MFTSYTAARSLLLALAHYFAGILLAVGKFSFTTELSTDNQMFDVHGDGWQRPHKLTKGIVLDLTKFNFIPVSDVDIAFPTFDTDPKLLEEAKARGFYNGSTPYNKMFSDLFFNGGNLKFKVGVDREFQQRAYRYLQALMGSWEPTHEDKEAVCAMLLSELAEAELG